MDELLTPLDIYNKEFNKTFSVWAYNSEEVEEFLDLVAESYEKLYLENEELRDRLADLEKRLQEYKDREETLNRTIDTVKETADKQQRTAEQRAESIVNNAKQKAANIKQQAKAQAELIMDKAEMKARKIVNQTNEKLEEERRKYKNLIESRELFEAKFKKMLKTYLIMLDENDGLEELELEQLDDLEKKDINELKNEFEDDISFENDISDETSTLEFDQNDIAAMEDKED
ncbi:DivIVA domain-containing protein [Sporohalobacter salinus]|uniref:DivIVA domain-containing protein n=1 Tax=Sporohalobacter salinus TaxID=1494606 RepID=UPI001960C5B6|nr:DivIVA domain-containing protein [Sporohalobacter salinus]MBM7624945.1 cell division initiation protein [Sporohalobacter salinus]